MEQRPGAASEGEWLRHVCRHASNSTLLSAPQVRCPHSDVHGSRASLGATVRHLHRKPAVLNEAMTDRAAAGHGEVEAQTAPAASCPATHARGHALPRGLQLKHEKKRSYIESPRPSAGGAAAPDTHRKQGTSTEALRRHSSRCPCCHRRVRLAPHRSPHHGRHQAMLVNPKKPHSVSSAPTLSTACIWAA